MARVSSRKLSAVRNQLFTVFADDDEPKLQQDVNTSVQRVSDRGLSVGIDAGQREALAAGGKTAQEAIPTLSVGTTRRNPTSLLGSQEIFTPLSETLGSVLSGVTGSRLRTAGDTNRGTAGGPGRVESATMPQIQGMFSLIESVLGSAPGVTSDVTVTNLQEKKKRRPSLLAGGGR